MVKEEETVNLRDGTGHEKIREENRQENQVIKFQFIKGYKNSS